MFKTSSVGFPWTWNSCKFIRTVLHDRVHKALWIFVELFFINFMILVDVRIHIIEHVRTERSRVLRKRQY